MRIHRDHRQHNESYVILDIRHFFRYIGIIPQAHLEINSFGEIYRLTRKIY